jgi:hypothetical protein
MLWIFFIFEKLFNLINSFKGNIDFGEFMLMMRNSNLIKESDEDKG